MNCKRKMCEKQTAYKKGNQRFRANQAATTAQEVMYINKFN